MTKVEESNLTDLLGDKDPLSWIDEVKWDHSEIDQEKIDLEGSSPGGRYEIKTYSLPPGYAHIIWDFCAEGNRSCSQPFLEKQDAIHMGHTTNSPEDAIQWHYKALKYLELIDPLN